MPNNRQKFLEDKILELEAEYIDDEIMGPSVTYIGYDMIPQRKSVDDFDKVLDKCYVQYLNRPQPKGAGRRVNRDSFYFVHNVFASHLRHYDRDEEGFVKIAGKLIRKWFPNWNSKEKRKWLVLLTTEWDRGAIFINNLTKWKFVDSSLYKRPEAFITIDPSKPIQRKYIEEYRIVRARDAQEKYPHLVKTDMDAKSQMLWLNDKELREYSDEIVKQQIRNRDGKRYVNDTTALDDGEEGVHIEDLLHAYRAERDEPNKLPEIQKYGRITNSHIIISNVLRKTATWNDGSDACVLDIGQSFVGFGIAIIKDYCMGLGCADTLLDAYESGSFYTQLSGLKKGTVEYEKFKKETLMIFSSSKKSVTFSNAFEKFNYKYSDFVTAMFDYRRNKGASAWLKELHTRETKFWDRVAEICPYPFRYEYDGVLCKKQHCSHLMNYIEQVKVEMNIEYLKVEEK